MLPQGGQLSCDAVCLARGSVGSDLFDLGYSVILLRWG